MLWADLLVYRRWQQITGRSGKTPETSLNHIAKTRIYLVLGLAPRTKINQPTEMSEVAAMIQDSLLRVWARR